MYTITCDGKTLHDPRLGEGYVVLGATLTLEAEKAGALEFTVEPTNQCYSDISPLKNRINVYRDGSCIWEGRPLKVETGFNLDMHIICEGRIAELRDAPFTRALINVKEADRAETTTIDGETFTRADGNLPYLYQEFFNRYNSFIDDPTKNFVLGNMDIPWLIYSNGRWDYRYAFDAYTPENDANFYDLLFDGYEESETNLGYYFPPITADYFGGHIMPRYRGEDVLIIDIIKDIGTEVATQKIEFGKNLLDLTRFIDAAEVYSIIYPIFLQASQSTGIYLDGSTSEINTTEGAKPLDGKILESPTLVNMFGRVIRPVEIYATYNQMNTQEAREQTASKQIELALNNALSIELTALDLSLLGINVDSIEIYKYYEIISAPHDFDEMYQCIAITRDLDEPQNDVYTFGATRETLTNWVMQTMNTYRNAASNDTGGE